MRTLVDIQFFFKYKIRKFQKTVQQSGRSYHVKGHSKSNKKIVK